MKVRLLFIFLLVSLPVVASADFDVLPTFAIEHAGVSIEEPVDEPYVKPTMAGDDLTGVTDLWTLQLYFPWPEDTPEERMIFALLRVSPDPDNEDDHIIHDSVFVKRAMSAGESEVSVSLPLIPLLGNPATPSAGYLFIAAQYPEYYAIYNPDTGEDELFPYTDADFFEWLAHPFAPGSHSPGDRYGIEFDYIAGGEAQSQPPTLSVLGQFRQFGVDVVPEGAAFVGNAAVFKGTIADSGAEVKFEVEVKPVGVAFDGADTMVSDLGAVGEFSVPVDELIPIAEHYSAGGNVKEFHWRARAVDAEGNTSEWQEFGTDPSVPDFTAKVVPLWTQMRSSFPERPVIEEWEDQLYASGVDSQCGSSGSATIGSCGCAITSLVMIARYHGIQNGVDGNPINPFTIDAWLKTHDGYVGENFVSWTKAEEYLGTTLDGSPHKVLALDYENFKTTSTSIVDSYLDQFTPVIAFKASAGHYLVIDNTITQASDTTYTVRDPRWYNTHTLNDTQNLAGEVKGYGNTFTHATIFTKLTTPTQIAAHTELYLASPAEILVTDPQGNRTGKDPATNTVYNEIPGALYYREDPISTSETDLDLSTVHQVKVLALPNLSDGNYSVKIIGTGTGSYTLTAASTNGAGETTTETFSDATTPNDVSEYELLVENGEPTDVAPTILELTAQLKTAIKQSNAKPLVKAALLVQVVAFEKAYLKGKIKEAKIIIVALEKEITLLKKKNQISPTNADAILGILATLKGVL